jgi:O-methyltransferase
MRSALRAMLRACTTDAFRNRISRVRAASDLALPIIFRPTYAEDGLISQHVCDFLEDPKFKTAYEVARDGIPWSHPGEIRYRAYIACWAAERALSLDGDLVECGVATAVLSRTICEYLNFATVNRTFFLFDTFQGIPVSTLDDLQEIDVATRLNRSHYAVDLLPLARARFERFPNVLIVPGVLPESLGQADLGRIAYLSIDLNNAGAEIGVIKALWDRLVPGAVVLLDDYAYGPEFANQKASWDAFAVEKRIPILSLPTGQGLIIR